VLTPDYFKYTRKLRKSESSQSNAARKRAEM